MSYHCKKYNSNPNNDQRVENDGVVLLKGEVCGVRTGTEKRSRMESVMTFGELDRLTLGLGGGTVFSTLYSPERDVLVCVGVVEDCGVERNWRSMDVDDEFVIRDAVDVTARGKVSKIVGGILNVCISTAVWGTLRTKRESCGGDTQ